MAEKKARAKKTKSTRAENLVIMIFSALIAVTAWVTLSITAFSDITITLKDVPIDFSLEGSYADLSGLSVVDRDIETVNISFIGQRESVGNYTNDDIAVTLDLNNVRTSGTYDIPLVVTSVHGDRMDDVQIGPQKTVHIEFDRFASKTLSVDSRTLTLNMDNITARSGFVIDPEEITITPSQVTISGPQDYIDQVTGCVISFDGSLRLNASENSSTSNVTLYSGEAVFENPRVSLDTSLFNVYIPVYMMKTLPLTLTIQNYSDKIDTSGIEYSLSENSITVRSQNPDVDKITSVSLGYADLRNIRPGAVMTYGIPLNSYYENISGVDLVQASFDLEGYAERNITIPNSQIHVVNASSDYAVTIQTDRLNVTVVGPEDVLNQIDASSFVAEIDLLEYNISAGPRIFSASVYAPGYSNVWALGINQVYANIDPAESVDANEGEEG